MLLKVEPPDLAQINEILSDIVWDEQRAGEIILGLRNLLNNRTEADLRPSDVNDHSRCGQDCQPRGRRPGRAVANSPGI